MRRAVMFCVRSGRALITLEVEANCAHLWESASLCNLGALSGYFFFLLSGLVDVSKGLSLAISVKQFGPFPSVIQVLQSQLIQRAGKCSPRQWRLVSSWDNLQPIPWPPWYAAAKGAHSYEQVTAFTEINHCWTLYKCYRTSVHLSFLILPVTT